MTFKVLWNDGKRIKKHALSFTAPYYVQTGIAATQTEIGVYMELFETETSEMAMARVFWGYIDSQDIVAFWRASQLLNLLEDPQKSDICFAIYASKRISCERERLLAVNLITQVGQTAIDEIMNTRIPQEVVNLIAQLAVAGERLNVTSLIEDIRQGTLEWQPEFAALSVLHPNASQRRQAAEAALVHDFEPDLVNYAESNKLNRSSVAISLIKAELMRATEKGINQTYGPDITIGIAILSHHRIIANWTAHHEAEVMSEIDWVNADPASVLESTISWLQTRFRHGIFTQERPIRSREDYRSILTELSTNFESMPIVADLTEIQ